MRHFIAFWICFALVLAVNTTTYALEKDGVSFPDQIQAHDGSLLRLNGLGTRKATIFGIRVYVAGLYIVESSHDPQRILNDPRERRVVMKFVRDVDRDDIAKAWKEGFEKNNPPSDELNPILMQMLEHAVSVRAGDTITVVVNQSRFALFVNDRELFAVLNPAFGKALLRIWLGEEPPNAALKSGLLGIE